MKILFFDLDTLRADHLGCYGYGRNTSPKIDAIAKDGVLFSNYFCPNAPCLPSRASLISGQYGIINGVVGHNATAADMRLGGQDRGFQDNVFQNSFVAKLQKSGFKTASISSFAERHSAWWFNAGFNECYNCGKGGMESLEEVSPTIFKWLKENEHVNDWFLHINLWDSHTPYRTPKEYKNIFENEPLCDDWITDELFQEHFNHVGPHSPQEISMYNDKPNPAFPKHPGRLDNLNDVKNFIDNYDLGIKYMDDLIGKIIDQMKASNQYDDLCIIVSSDHGENMGELGIYGEHATADYPTCNIPMIIKWSGGQKNLVNNDLHDNVDLAPTICDLINAPKSDNYNGTSFANTILLGENNERDSVVLTQCAHVCQRASVFDDYLYIVTLHGGLHLFDKEMLFNIKNDPHQINNIAKQYPELCAKGAKYIFDWQNNYMELSPYQIDPLWTVMKEGGPFHSQGMKKEYIERLKKTGRESKINELEEKYKNFD